MLYVILYIRYKHIYYNRYSKNLNSTKSYIKYPDNKIASSHQGENIKTYLYVHSLARTHIYYQYIHKTMLIMIYI